MGGSAKRTAVADTVLGAAKVPGRFQENTPKAVPPFIPATSELTSPATIGFYKQINTGCIKFAN